MARAYDWKTGCDVEATLSVIGGRWKPVLLFHLLGGKQRFNALCRLTPNATQRMITLQRQGRAGFYGSCLGEEAAGCVAAISSHERPATVASGSERTRTAPSSAGAAAGAVADKSSSSGLLMDVRRQETIGGRDSKAASSPSWRLSSTSCWATAAGAVPP